MKYVKAKARVVLFDNSDVVTASAMGGDPTEGCDESNFGAVGNNPADDPTIGKCGSWNAASQ